MGSEEELPKRNDATERRINIEPAAALIRWVNRVKFGERPTWTRSKSDSQEFMTQRFMTPIVQRRAKHSVREQSTPTSVLHGGLAYT